MPIRAGVRLEGLFASGTGRFMAAARPPLSALSPIFPQWNEMIQAAGAREHSLDNILSPSQSSA